MTDEDTPTLAQRNVGLITQERLPEDPGSFSLLRLYVWIAMGLVIIWLLMVRPLFDLSSVSAAFVLGVFLLIDIATQNSRRYHGFLVFSYYSAALAYSVAASCLVLFLFYTPPEPASRSAMSFWEEVYYLLSGQWLTTALGPVLKYVVLLLIHFYLFLGLTLISFVPAAVCCIRKGPDAAWLVLLNLPGMAFIGWGVYEYLREMFL